MNHSKRGRPSARELLTARVTALVTEEEKDDVERRAALRGWTVSVYLRKLIQLEVEP